MSKLGSRYDIVVNVQVCRGVRGLGGRPGFESSRAPKVQVGGPGPRGPGWVCLALSGFGQGTLGVGQVGLAQRCAAASWGRAATRLLRSACTVTRARPTA